MLVAFPASQGGRPGTAPHRWKGLGVRYRNISTGGAASACTPRTGLGTLGPLHMVSAAGPWPASSPSRARSSSLHTVGKVATDTARLDRAPAACHPRPIAGTLPLPTQPKDTPKHKTRQAASFPCSRACILCCVRALNLLRACCGTSRVCRGHEGVLSHRHV